MSDDADQDGRQCGADQRGAADQSHVQLAETERKQIRRQQHGDKSVAKAAQPATDEQG
jgi:hypothetical protein